MFYKIQELYMNINFKYECVENYSYINSDFVVSILPSKQIVNDKERVVYRLQIGDNYLNCVSDYLDGLYGDPSEFI